jgi:uncharacterized OB-fold protein
VQHHAVAPGFEGERPYAIALVNPVEAAKIRLLGRIVETPLENLRNGKRVKVVFVAHKGGDFKVPCWRVVD